MSFKRRAGFNIVELLVVIGIIGIVFSLLAPAVQHAREAASRSGCMNNMKQIGLALHIYHDANGHLPPVQDFTTSPTGILSWMVHILPELEENSLYQTSVAACSTNPDPLENPPHVGLATVMREFICPDDSRLLTPLISQGYELSTAFTSYIGIGGAYPSDGNVSEPGVLAQGPGTRLLDILDGTSNTIMVGERPPPNSLQAGWWYPANVSPVPLIGPNGMMYLGPVVLFPNPCAVGKGTFGPGQLNNPCDRFHLWSLHPGGGNFLFADGSVRFLSYSVEPLMISLATRSGGEIVTIP